MSKTKLHVYAQKVTIWNNDIKHAKPINSYEYVVFAIGSLLNQKPMFSHITK